MENNELTALDQTVFIDSESLVRSQGRRPYLVIYVGAENGRRHLLKRGSMTIGRSSQADLQINDERISRVHCVIEWLGDTIMIEDKESTNGTYVDSKEVKRKVVLPGIPIQLGHSLMKIEYKSEEEIQSEENLLHRAAFDELTGIFNRQHFIKLARMELANAARYKLTAGVIMMDIDNFKQVNDTYGHPFGDIVLSQLANIVVENKRIEDLFGRYGGEEFIILPRCKITEEDLRIQCDRIRNAIQDHEFSYDGVSTRITVSIGFSMTIIKSGDVETALHDLIGKADQALYMAKDSGRNQTRCLL